MIQILAFGEEEKGSRDCLRVTKHNNPPKDFGISQKASQKKPHDYLILLCPLS